MSAPTGLVGAALLLWGTALGLSWLGALLGLAFEVARRAVTPSATASRRLGRAARLGLLLALAALPGWLALQGLPQGLYAWLRWLPPMLLPLALLPSALARPTWGGLRGVLQPGRGVAADEDAAAVDLTHAFASLALASAGTGAAAAAGPPGWLYAGDVAIVGWALLARQERTRRGAAAGLVAAAAVIGFGVQAGLFSLQGQVEEWSTDLIAQWLSGPPDAFRERTRIGELGRVKLSDRIVMRVSTDGPRPQSLLLREAVFERYRGGEWQSARRNGTAIARAPAPSADTPLPEASWQLGTGAAAARAIVRRTLPGGTGLLPLPLGTMRIGSLPAEALDRLPAGAVRVHGGPRFIAMQVEFDELAEQDKPDAALDLEVPPVLREALARVIGEEQLARADGNATLGAVREFFATKFAYSLDLGRREGLTAGREGRTVPDFLLRDRRGHCEYFATATTLLLRQLGIPARYVGGYSAQEYSAREQAFIVRARHAHAWTQAWIDGRWVNVDTTPARWAEAEEAEARSPFGPLLDLGSWLVDRLLQAWLDVAALDVPTAGRAAVLAAFAGVVAAGLGVGWLGWRRRRSRRRAIERGEGAAEADGVAQAWQQVERRAAAVGLARRQGETVRAWIGRIGGVDGHSGDDEVRRRHEGLRDLGEAYYRARFDPAASHLQRSAFVDAAAAWHPPSPSGRR